MGFSPQSLSPELIDDFRTIMTRVSPGDWDAHRRRVDRAASLGRRAFLERDRAAWEVVQVIEWRLQRNNRLRPTEPGDVHVLDTLYRIEESTLPAIALPTGLTPREFCERLERDIAVYSAVDSPIIKMFVNNEFTKEDWRYLAYQILAPSNDFTRMICIASLPLPHSHARFMYYNLYDEAGRGVWEKCHHVLLENFVREYDVDTTDEEKLLYWTCPEHLAMINVQNRLLWHPEPGWALGSMYLYEKLLPSELSKMRKHLLDIGTKKEALAWFDEHIVVDVQHAEEWLGVVEGFLLAHADQVIAYRAAMERGKWARGSWDAILNSWRQWKASGTPPHLPARELREATGL